MSDVVIRVERLTKVYRLGQWQPHRMLRDALPEAFRRLGLAKVNGNGGPHPARPPRREAIRALNDVSFDVRRGDVVGIIGRNGAGKSTLLKVLSRITEPTEGQARIGGRVGTLLEVGCGFHPDLTGRENVYLNGAILGMRRDEVRRRFDEIVAFAEVERFIDTPVKRYSSGMYMRLAFAVAAHLETEILFVDEVLAVGDTHFQKKCLGKMGEAAQGGRTVLFVSHNMDTMQRLCDRGVFLEDGRLLAEGPIAEVVSHYRRPHETQPSSSGFDPTNRCGLGWARITDVRLVDDSGQSTRAAPCDRDLDFEIDLELVDPETRGGSLRGLVLEVIVCSENGQPLLTLMNVDDGGVALPSATACRVKLRLPGPTFVPNRYTANLYLGIPFLQHVDELVDAFSFEILPPARPWRPYEIEAESGIFCRQGEWRLDGITRAAPESARTIPQT